MVELGAFRERTDRLRPVRSACAEGLHGDAGSWTPDGINGFLMRVDDPNKINSNVVTTSKYGENLLVRVSTNRPYTANDAVGLGQRVVQPGDLNSTDDSDVVGRTCAKLWGDDIRADVAVRTAHIANECPDVHNPNTNDGFMHHIHRNTDGLVGDDILLYHRGDDHVAIEQRTVTDVQAEATLTYDTNSDGSTTVTHTLTNQIITDAIEKATDRASGSPVLHTDSSLVGLFAGIDDSGNGVITPVNTIENMLGANALTGLKFGSLDTLPTI